MMDSGTLHRGMIALLILAMAGCDSGGDDAAEDGEGTPTEGTHTFSATVDGEAVEPDVVFATVINSTLRITATDTISGEVIVLRLPGTSEGSYEVSGTGASATLVTGNSPTENDLFVGVSGEITIDLSNDDRIEGTFDFTADSNVSGIAGKTIPAHAAGLFIIILTLEPFVTIVDQPDSYEGIACVFQHPFGPTLWNPAEPFFLFVGGHAENGELAQFGLNAQTFGAWEDYAGNRRSFGFPPADVSVSFIVSSNPEDYPLRSGMTLPLGLREDISSVSFSMKVENEEGSETIEFDSGVIEIRLLDHRQEGTKVAGSADMHSQVVNASCDFVGTVNRLF